MKKKQKSIEKKGTAILIDETGAIKTKVFDLIKSNKEKKTVLIALSSNKKYWVKRRHIRGNRILIYQKSDGKVIAQNPDNWGKLNLKKQGVKTLRFNLQNQSLQESKSAVYRWTAPQTALDKLGPIFRLMFICITLGVIAWSALKFGGMALDTITRSRLMDCSSLLPKVIDPIGAIMNSSIPVGT
jgi:hypothetical protein